MQKRTASACCGIRAALLLCAAACSIARAEVWRPHPDCATPACDAAHTCLSNICSQRWDVCPENFTQTKSDVAIDNQDCYDNGCGYGGCDDPDYREVSAKSCTNLQALCFHTCKQETCCRLRAAVTCCQRLECTVDKADCRVPQQQSLGPTGTGTANIKYTTLADGGTSQFPFYQAAEAEEGDTCDDLQTWGVCICQDGQPSPGCLTNDSSTWFVLGSQQDPPPRLAPGLSLTCWDDRTAVPAAQPGAGTPDAAAGAGGGVLPPGGHRSHKKRLSGGAIALIVVLSVLGGLTLLGGAVGLVVLSRAQRPAPRELWTGGSPTGGSGSNYEPVFTGVSYTPPLKRPSGARLPKLGELVTSVRTFMQTARHRLGAAEEEGAAAARAAYHNHLAARDAEFAAKYPLSAPALPDDVEEDEALYTLEDLDDAPPMARAHPGQTTTGGSGPHGVGYYYGGPSAGNSTGGSGWGMTGGSYTGLGRHSGPLAPHGHYNQQPYRQQAVMQADGGQEVELGAVHSQSQPKQQPKQLKQQPQLQQGTSPRAVARTEVIRTTPVNLGPPPEAQYHPPPTPQPTGGAPRAPRDA